MARLAQWLASRNALRVALALGVLATLPALGVGLVHDDLMQRLALEGAVPGYARGPHELYDFTGSDPGGTRAMIEAGYFPWFTDPALSLRFFRPLSSLLLALDVALFGRAALPAHVHSLLWFVLIACAAAAIFRRVLSPRAATLATLVYVLAGAHADTTAWLAARHTLVGAALGALAVWAHVAGRTQAGRAQAGRAQAGRTQAGRPQGRSRIALLAVPALLVGMLASETALGAVVFILLYELIVSEGPRRERVVAALPVLALGLAHLAFYVLSGYGTKESGAYISPFDDPGAFAGAIVSRGALLVAELYGALPSLITSMLEPAQVPGAIYGALAAAGCALVLYRGRDRRAERSDGRPTSAAVCRGRDAVAQRSDPCDRLAEGEGRALLWLGLSSVVCLAPMVGGVVGGRLLPLSLVGSAAVVGAAIVLAFELASKTTVARRLGFGAIGVALVLLHLGFSPLVRLSMPSFLANVGEAERELARRADAGECREGSTGYLLTGADPVLSLYAAPALLYYEPEKAAWLSRMRVLSMAPHAQELTVTGADRFELRVLDGPREANLFETVYRDAPLSRGHRVQAGELTATVLEVERGLPTHVAFEVEGGLESICFLTWRDGQLAALPTPELGRSRSLPHELGPMGL